MKFWHRNTDIAVPVTSANDEAAVDSTSVMGKILGSDLRTPSMNNQTEDVETGHASETGRASTDNER